jgi:type IV fimbrial biogenesis protein FimT
MICMGQNRNTQAAGYTLLELMVVVAIVGILSTMAVPGFRDSIGRNTRESAAADLVSSLSLARSEAVTQSANIAVCRSTDQATCANSSEADWNDGWLVFTDLDSDGAVDVGESLLQAHSSMQSQAKITLLDSANGTIVGDFLHLDSDGFLKDAATGAYFKLCDVDDESANHRAIFISNTGKVTRSGDDADGIHNDLAGDDLECL